MTPADDRDDVASCPVTGARSLVAAAEQDPGAAFDQLALEGPVVWNEETRTWYVLAESTARPLLRDKRLRARGIPPALWDLPEDERDMVLPIEQFLARWLVFSDPPKQRVVRRALAPVLTRAANEHVVTGAVHFSRMLLDAHAGRDGSLDLVTDVARPIARTVTQLLLAADDEAMDQIVTASDALIDYLATDGFDVPKARVAQEELVRLTATVRDRLLPGDGVVALALRPLVADGEIELVDVVAAYAQLLTGALEPLATTLTGAVVRMALGAGAAPRDDDEWRAFIEAQLAEEPAFHFAPRVSSEPMEIEGVEVPGGARVVINLLAANRDASRRDVPTAEHLSFGAGTHFCLGAALTRALLPELLRVLVDAGLPWAVMVDAVGRRPIFGMTGYATVPVRLDRVLTSRATTA